MIRLTAYVSGRVQRTGYRAKVVSLAKEMGLVGFVQNRPEGQVLVIAEGENKDDLERSTRGYDEAQRCETVPDRERYSRDKKQDRNQVIFCRSY